MERKRFVNYEENEQIQKAADAKELEDLKAAAPTKEIKDGKIVQSNDLNGIEVAVEEEEVFMA